LPYFFEDLLVLSDQLTFAVFTILFKPTSVFSTVDCRKISFSIHEVASPLTFISISLSHEELTMAVSLACTPVSDV
jgi:hypothetical protein